MYGWAGRVLWVELTSRTILKEPLDRALRLHYLGGRGINSRLLYDNVGVETDPLGPENCLIFGTGPLVGTLAPSCGRYTVSAKSPLTGILGDANSGGHFSPEIKWAGYDHIVFQGKAERPVYLWIDDDRVEIREADHLWGKTTWETERIIKEELDDPRVQIASIGPAGEKLVKLACVINNLARAAGRCGMGAVMGSKNLKAIAVRGTKGVSVARPEAFVKLAWSLRQRIMENPGYPEMSTYGTPHITVLLNELGILPVRNLQQVGEYKEIDQVSHEFMAREFFIKSKGCFACPTHCSHYYVVKEGPYAGERGHGIEYGATTWGPPCGNSYAASYFKANNLCNQYGLDVFGLPMVVAAAMEWYQRGIISQRDTDGIPLEWGNHGALIEIIHKVARREGFGDILAEGVVKAAEKIGRGAEKYINHSKGLAWHQEDVRALKGYALNMATSTRGADHLRGLPVPELFGMDPEVARARFGTPEAVVPGSYDKAAVTIFYQNLAAVADALEVCKFSTEFLNQAMGMKELSQLFSLATGEDLDEEALVEAGERIFALERAFLVREGISRKDDVLVGRWGTEPVPNGPHKGERIDPLKWQAMLDEYYSFRGWERESGIPSRAKLEALGLQDIAEDLERMGRL